MLLTSPSRARATNVPLLLGVMAAFLAFSVSTAVVAEEWGAALGGAALTALLMAVLATALRRIWVEGDALCVRTPYGLHELDVRRVALGINIRYSSRGGPTYTVYALTDTKPVDLAESISEKGAERLRERLRETLLSGRLDDGAAREAERIVAGRDARWRRKRDDAQAKVKASARTTWIVVGVVGFVVLYMLGVGAYVYFGG